MAEVLVAVMLAVTVVAGTMATFASVIRYLKQVEDKNKGASGGVSAVKLIEKIFRDASCIPQFAGDCLAFNNICQSQDLGSAKYIVGRRHATGVAGASYFAFKHDTSAQTLEFCPTAAAMAMPPTCSVSYMTVSRDVISTDIAAGTCDSATMTVSVNINVTTLKDKAGTSIQTRNFNTKAKIPMGLGL